MSIKHFSNVMVYRLRKELSVAQDELEDLLGRAASRPLGHREMSQFGFIRPFGDGGAFVETIRPNVLYLSAIRRERSIPARVVKEEVTKRVRVIEDEQMRNVGRKERDGIKDEVLIDLIPRAFETTARINALICPPYIFVDQSSPKRAEDFLSLLRQTLGSLSVLPVMVKDDPAATMTGWVLDSNNLPYPLTVGEAFQSRSRSQKDQTLSGKKVDLSDEEIRNLLTANREVTQLELGANISGTTMWFKLTNLITIKGLKWPADLSDTALDHAGADNDNSVALERSILFIISSLLMGLVAELLQAFGGETKVELKPASPDSVTPEGEDELV